MSPQKSSGGNVFRSNSIYAEMVTGFGCSQPVHFRSIWVEPHLDCDTTISATLLVIENPQELRSNVLRVSGCRWICQLWQIQPILFTEFDHNLFQFSGFKSFETSCCVHHCEWISLSRLTSSMSSSYSRHDPRKAKVVQRCPSKFRKMRAFWIRRTSVFPGTRFLQETSSPIAASELGRLGCCVHKLCGVYCCG